MATPEVKKEEQLNVESLTCCDLTWVNIDSPTRRESEYLAQHFPFHPLNLDDLLSRLSRPKMDEYKDHLFIVLHFPFWNREQQAIISSELNIFIGENYVVTVDCTGNLKTLAKFFKVCQSDEESQRENFSQGSAYLLYRIIDRLVDCCLPILNKIGDKIEGIEDVIFLERRPAILRDISILRREVIAFRRIIWPIRAVIGSLEPKVHRFSKTDLAVYFGDMVDHLDKIWDGLDEYKEVVEGLHATRDSLAANRLNDILRVLTIVATIATTLTVIVSFYGMNIPIPGSWEAPGGSHLTLRFVLLAIGVATGGMLFYFYRKHWI
jgi:magnesium transporter